MLDGPPSEPQIFTLTSADASLHLTNGVVARNEPPDLPHITERFIPLAHVILVLARSAYLDLCRLRESCLDQADQKRKKKIVEHASRYRAETVKLLILVNWAARADEVSRAIDLRAWLQGQKNCFDNLYGHLRYDVLRNLESAKTVGPDIASATDVLTTGTVPPLKHTQVSRTFQIKDNLNPVEILRTLRTLDTLISLRLLLHEVLPVAMQDYIVKSGRVTFTVNNEFSIDLFFATDEVESSSLQWFMIDFRFAFTKDDQIDTPMTLKLEIENTSNALLARCLAEGRAQLVELYNFLHSFTIQYKLERLFSQFSSIGGREKGRIDIKYASAQKVLAVGFWLTQRHREKKSVLNSLTVTIDAPEVSAREQFLSNPRIAHAFNRERLKVVIRHGEQEQSLGQISIEEHSASSLLKAVVQQQMDSILQALFECLNTDSMPFTKSSTSFKGAYLSIELLRDEVLRVWLDEFSGAYLVSLVVHGELETELSIALQNLQLTLNIESQIVDRAVRLHEYKYSFIKQELVRSAAATGWSQLSFPPSSLHLGEFATAIGGAQRASTSVSSCIFLQRGQAGWKRLDPSQGSSWSLIINCQSQALYFTLAEMDVLEASAKWQIQWIHPWHFYGDADHLTIHERLGSSFFADLARMCTVRIVTLRLQRSLNEHNIPHRLVDTRPGSKVAPMRMSEILFSANAMPRSLRPWTIPLVKFSIAAIGDDGTDDCTVLFDCEMLSTIDFDIAACCDETFHTEAETNKFSLRFLTNVSLSENLLFSTFYHKWNAVRNIVDIVDANNNLPKPFLLQSKNLSSATFVYEQTYLLEFRQQQSLASERPRITIVLGSCTGKRNPHTRITEYLTNVADSCHGNMKWIFMAMITTFPLLESFDQIEQENFYAPAFYIFTRSLADYRIYYPDKSVALLIRGRTTPKDRVPEQFWKLADIPVLHFTDASQSSQPVAGQLRINSCERIFNVGLNEALNTDLTCPEGSGICCVPELASRVLREVHRTIMEDQASTRIFSALSAPSKEEIRHVGAESNGNKAVSSASSKAQSDTARKSRNIQASSKEVIEIS